MAEISIKNFAIIDELSVSFQKGFTVLTGETGAGKSIIIDAIGLLVGGRGSADFIRHGKDKAEIEGLFLIEDDHPAIEKLNQMGIESEDGMIVLKRDIYLSGKSVCRINGKLATISSLREVGGKLVDIHGQNENQELMDVSSHLRLLDEFSGEETKRARKEYASIYHEYDKIKIELKQLTENEQEMAQKLDLLLFQQKEIAQANLQIGEDEELAIEKNKIANFEQLYESLTTAYESLRGEQKGLDWLGLSLSNIEEAAQIDEDFQATLDLMSNSFYQLEDTAYQLRQTIDQLEYDPQRLNEVEERLNLINQMKRKYGKTIEAILEYGAKVEEEIEIITNRDSHIEKMEKKLESVEKDLLVEGRHLTSLRKKNAKKLTKAVHKELKDLYMDKTEFEVRFLDNNSFREDGMDQVEFYLSTNPGEPKKQLTKIASGGEMSRIMLALKTIFSKHQNITSIIFDEVDTGVSGRVAQSIGEKIYQISSGSQVLSITHLPQVASMSDYHYYIAKEIHDNHTKTAIRILDEEERVKEIARMISGTAITAATENHAREMLEMSNSRKSVIQV